MLNFDLIEEQISAHNVAGITTGCMFCEVDQQLVLTETKNLYLIRDKYPVADGHLMVISKGHYGCMGELPQSHFTELELLREFTQRHYQKSRFITYEHGRAGHCVKLHGSQVTCHHFHLHFLPLEVDIHPALERSYNAKPTQNLMQVREYYQKFGEYLYFENSLGLGRYYAATHHVQPHLLRTLVCQASGLDQRSDWETL